MDSKWKDLQQEVQELRVLINYYRKKDKDSMRESNSDRKKDKDSMRVSISDQSSKYSNGNNTEEEVQKRKPYSKILPREISNILRDKGEPMTKEEIVRGLKDRNIEILNEKRTMDHTVAISLGKNPLFEIISDNENGELKKFGLANWQAENEKGEEK